MVGTSYNQYHKFRKLKSKYLSGETEKTNGLLEEFKHPFLP